jgi:MoxR-vWA-beta-propeller ternary system protein
MSIWLDAVSCARVPEASLPALAMLRCQNDIQAICQGQHVWIRWHTGDEEVLRQVLPVPGVELYIQQDGQWFRAGQRLPVDAPPEGPMQSLDQLLVPERATPKEPSGITSQPVRLTLVRDGRVRATTALLCSVSALHDWAGGATTRQLVSLKAARCGSRVLLLGEKLPAVAEGVRLWGRQLLVPLGYRPQPALPASALVAAIGLREGEIALLLMGPRLEIEIVPEESFYTLTRAAARLAVAELRP